MIDTGVHGNPVDPRRELGVLPEARQRPVDFDEHILGDVLRVVVVAGELVGHAVDHRSMLLDEHPESGRVAARRTRDQFRVNHQEPSRA